MRCNARLGGPMDDHTGVHLVDDIAIMTLVPHYVVLLLFRRCHRSIWYHLN